MATTHLTDHYERTARRKEIDFKTVSQAQRKWRNNHTNDISFFLFPFKILNKSLSVGINRRRSSTVVSDAYIKADGRFLIWFVHLSSAMPGTYTHKFDTPTYKGDVTINTG